MKYPLVFLLALFPLFSSHASEHIVFYRMRDDSARHLQALKKYLNDKGYRVSVYEAAKSMEKQIENANRINREKASVFIAMDLSGGEKKNIFIAIPDTKKTEGKFLAADEVPEFHIDGTRELASMLAETFKTRFVRLPLFPVAGMDMPALYMNMEMTGNTRTASFESFHRGLQKYFQRRNRNEK